MIKAIIRWSVQNPLLVLISTLALALFGYQASQQLKLDALPDLSDVQVIIKTSYPGQTPETIEQQISYPLSSALLAVPKAKAVRSFSMPNDSYLYVIFEDDTDPYWARSRVLEYLQTVTLPAGANATLGPDASGVGWIFQYALVDRTGQQSLEQLSSLQQFFLKPELQSVSGVAEVASIGGMVRQYQVVLDPDRMRVLGVTQNMVTEALQKANQSAGGSVVELAEAEYMVRSRGFLQSLEDFRTIPINVVGATPVLLRDIASVRFPSDGGAQTLNRAQPAYLGARPFDAVHGAGYRAVYDFADLDNSRFAIPLGQSGNMLSPWSRNFVERWQALRYIEIAGTRAENARTAVGTLTLAPPAR